MAFIDLLIPRRGARIEPDPTAAALLRRHLRSADAAPDSPARPVVGTGAAASPMRLIADRLEQRIAADFAMFDTASSRRRGDGPPLRRLAAHLAAEAKPLHALGPFTVALELSAEAANAWLLPDDVDPASLPGGWADALYSNRLAYSAGWASNLAGIRHLLRPGGPLVADLPVGDDGRLDHDLAGSCRETGFDVIEVRDPGGLQGRAWRRAILARRAGG